MGANTQDYLEFVKEQLGLLPGLSSKPFFGGVALYAGPVQFAMVMDQTLYFVVDERTRPAYEGMGSRPFGYQTKKGWVDVKKYFEVPGDLLEDTERLQTLAQEAIRAAQAAKANPAKRGKTTRGTR
ncbi:MAG TPA: TfoX/Sxy family protein [Holophagaceae bacterium]|jgi:DNA transformation protein|nr:TfoX/Sxy family protein [Holophagaceae bacterium]